MTVLADQQELTSNRSPDTGCSQEDLSGAMNEEMNREREREREREKERERERGAFMLVAWHDDDDDD